MKIKYDFKELNKFLNKVSDPSKLDARFTMATKKIAKVLHKNLREQTPVDTGKLKKMWNAGDNLKFTVEKTATGYIVTLINSASNNKSPKYPDFKYGLAVNDGHRKPYGTGWVMGRFFVENSIDLTYPKVEEIIMKELEKLWR